MASVLGQTEPDFELLLWDDGSTDATREKLREFAQDDSRCRVVGTDSVGLVEALRRLGKAASGRFLTRMDADDVCLPMRFERQAAFLDANQDMGLCGCLHETFGGGIGSGRVRYDAWMNALVQPEAVRRELFVECPVAHPSFMLPADTYRAVGGYRDHGWPEDYDLVMRVAASGAEIGKVSEVLLRWRRHSGQTSMTHERYSEERFRALKRHYLPKFYGAKLDRLYQWGAGQVGKRWLREWTDPKPRAVVDIHPRKVGTRIHAYPVIAPEELPAPGEAFTVVTVGAPGARDDIREWFTPRGYAEGRDYVFLA